MQTNFEKVSFYNRVIGNESGNKNYLDREAMEDQLFLVDEEVNELFFNLDRESINGVRDAIADILITLYGLAYRAGVNADDSVEFNSGIARGEGQTNFNLLTGSFDWLPHSIAVRFNVSDSGIKRCCVGIDLCMSHLFDAVDEEDSFRLAECISQMIVSVYFLAFLLGVDADSDLDIAHNSNMSKFCINADDASRTTEKYNNIGIKTMIKGSFPDASVISSVDQYDDKGKFYKRGKQLKSIDWKEPNFK